MVGAASRAGSWPARHSGGLQTFPFMVRNGEVARRPTSAPSTATRACPRHLTLLGCWGHAALTAELIASSIAPLEAAGRGRAMATPRVDRRLAAIWPPTWSATRGSWSRRGARSPAEGAPQDCIDPMIAEHRGRIVKLTGDGVLVEFASVVDAVRCAVEIQQRHGRAQRRGAARTSGSIPHRHQSRRRDRRGDGDIFGDGVNVAARLEAARRARWHLRLRHGPRTDRRASSTSPSRIIGEQRLKNIARPVRVYRRPSPAPGARPARRPLCRCPTSPRSPSCRSRT